MRVEASAPVSRPRVEATALLRERESLTPAGGELAASCCCCCSGGCSEAAACASSSPRDAEEEEEEAKAKVTCRGARWEWERWWRW